MTGRCCYCGSSLIYRPSRSKECLAIAEERRAVLSGLRSSSDLPLIAERLRQFGYREVWGIAFRCPGCGRGGGSFRPEYSQPEAVEISAAQNASAESPTALSQASGWRHEVRRRAVRDAHYFASLLRSRIPEWAPHLELIEPSEDVPDLEWDCALVARIPPVNPAVESPLEVRVLCGEVRPSWGRFWHTHLTRSWEADGEDMEHVHRAVDLLANLAEEQLLILTKCLDGVPGSGGCMSLGAPLPQWALSTRDGSRHLAIRSWRGTWDQDIIPTANPT